MIRSYTLKRTILLFLFFHFSHFLLKISLLLQNSLTQNRVVIRVVRFLVRQPSFIVAAIFIAAFRSVAKPYRDQTVKSQTQQWWGSQLLRSVIWVSGQHITAVFLVERSAFETYIKDSFGIGTLP